MPIQKPWPMRVAVTALALMAIASGHLIEDYLYGVHTGFGLSEPVGMLLAILYYAIFGLIMMLAARGNRAGVIGCLAMGIFLALAECLYHGPEVLFVSPYRNGWFSKALEIVVTGGSVVLAVVSALALRASPKKS